MSAAPWAGAPVGTGAAPAAVRTLVRSHPDPAVTRLAAGVAHDVNNVLAVITLRADLALDGVRSGAPTDEAVEDLTAIIGAAVRAAELTETLLLVAGRPAAPAEPLDLRAVVGGLRSRVETAAVVPTAVDWDLHPVPTVLAPAAAVERVVLALVANALDATSTETLDPTGAASADSASTGAASPGAPAGPRVVVRLAPAPPAPPAEPTAGPLATGVRLEISDRGGGMTPEVAARAAEPYAHHGPAAGRGLELAVVLGIVTAAGGTLEIESAAGGGTTVRVTLPAAAAAPATPPASAPALAPPTPSAPRPAPTDPARPRGERGRR